MNELITKLEYCYRAFRLQCQGLAEADRIFTETTETEKDTLFKLARRKAGGIGVEIGSAFGASSCFIAAGLRPGGGRLHCIDRWNVEYRREGDRIVNYLYCEDGRLVSYQWDEDRKQTRHTELGSALSECPTYTQFLVNTRVEFSDVIHPIRKDSVAAAATFSSPIDFLFIDGWHAYDAVKKDCEVWLPKVKPGGIVVFHDSGWAEGVKLVIAEDILPRAAEHAHLPNMFWAVIQRDTK